MLNWRVASPNTLRSYQTAAKDFETITGIPVDQADLVTILTWQASMQARGLGINTIRARLSAVSLLSGVKVQLPKKQKTGALILSEEQIKAFFQQIQKDSDREFMVQILLTGSRPRAAYHWLGAQRMSFSTQEVTRKIKRYARMAGLDETQVNMRTLVRSGKELTAQRDAVYIVENILPAPRKQTVEWRPLHGIGRRSKHLLKA